MTKIITIATRKGGSGKTTLATNLAVMSAIQGFTSLIIDCDFETKVASRWFGIRDNSNLDSNLFCVESYKQDHLKELIGKAKENAVEYVYIDTPGTGDNLVNEAVVQSDYCLIPCGAGGFDILPLQKTVELINKLNKKASFVITKAVSSSNEAHDAEKLLRSFGLNISDVKLTNLKLYRDAAVLGKSVFECNPESKSAHEIKMLLKWLRGRLIVNPIQSKLQGN